MSKKGKSLIKIISLVLVVIIVFVTLSYVCFAKSNCIDFHNTIDINASTTVEVYQKDKKSTYKNGDSEFFKIEEILSDKNLSFNTSNVILTDENYKLTLKNGTHSHTYYFAFSGEDAVTVVVWNFAEGKDTSVALDYPYYIVTKISVEEFKTIFTDYNEKWF